MNNIYKDILLKRFQTTMIGSIYEFEKQFGYLWGIDKEENELSIEQKNFRLKWENTRNSILNNGNDQLRKCLSELDKLTSNTKFNYKFYNRRNK